MGLIEYLITILPLSRKKKLTFIQKHKKKIFSVEANFGLL